jgi:hypothetical protein
VRRGCGPRFHNEILHKTASGRRRGFLHGGQKANYTRNS